MLRLAQTGACSDWRPPQGAILPLVTVAAMLHGIPLIPAEAGIQAGPRFRGDERKKVEASKDEGQLPQF